MPKTSFEETVVEVWRQALVENSKFVRIGTESYPVRRTAKRGLRQVDFAFDGIDIRGLKQNPATKIPMGAIGAIWQEGNAIPQCRPVCGKRCRWEGDSLWGTPVGQV